MGRREVMADELLLTVTEAARRLGMGRSFFYELLRRGEVDSITLGHARRVPVRALVEFAERLQREQQEKD
jgi:excisionase family DNA binding protein